MGVNLTFEELSKYRQKDGNINLNDVINDNVDLEREVRGNEKRAKEWFDVKNGRVMFKSNSEEQIYAHYSELICCALAKQIDKETAEYDLAVYEGQVGVITKDVCKTGEEMLTINDLIGDGPTSNEYPDSTDIFFVFNQLETKLLTDGYGSQEVDDCMLDLRKQLLFDLYVMETDRHVENLSFIVSKDEKTGKPTIRLAPMYDTEAALVLYDNPEYMKKVYSSFMITGNVTNLQEPKICVIPEHEDEEEKPTPLGLLAKLQSQVGPNYGTESEEIWKTTLDFLCEDRRAFKYLEEELNKMDIRQAIETVENDKKCEIPEDIKKMAITCFEDRKRAIEYELMIDIDSKEISISPKELT